MMSDTPQLSETRRALLEKYLRGEIQAALPIEKEEMAPASEASANHTLCRWFPYAQLAPNDLFSIHTCMSKEGRFTASH